MHRSLAREGERDFPSSSFRFEIPQHTYPLEEDLQSWDFIEASTARRDLKIATKEEFRKGGITFHRDDALSQDSGLTNLARKKKKKITTKWQLKSFPKIPNSSISFVPASWMRRKEEEEDPATTKSILLPRIDLK
jgi:hypothetical protein